MNTRDALERAAEYYREGRVEEAAHALESVLADDPDHLDGLLSLGTLRQQVGRTREAIELFRRATEAAPNSADAHYNLGNVLYGANEPEASCAAFRAACDRDPTFGLAFHNLGCVLYDVGDVAAAVNAFENAVGCEPDAAEMWANFGMSLLAAGNTTASLDALDRCMSLDPRNVNAIAHKALALNLPNAAEGTDALLDFDRLVRVMQIEVPRGYSGLTDFNDALASHVLGHPTLSADPSHHATRQGRHSGELLVEPLGPMAPFAELVNAAVRTYVSSLPTDEAHPFLSDPLRSWNLAAWGVVLGRDGHQVPHLHLSAWVSGVYYVRVPEAVASSVDNPSGWLEFGRPDPRLRLSISKVRRLKPSAGVLVLFPSYFFHGTVPLRIEDERISIAFDASRDS